MTTFNESDHPRGDDGKFGTKHHQTVDADLTGPADEGYDPPEVYLRNGVVIERSFFKHGELHDGADGEAADQAFYDDGAPRFECRYQNGKVSNSPDGKPAWMSWHSNGKIREVNYHTDGAPTNSPSGEPAKRSWYKNEHSDG